MQYLDTEHLEAIPAANFQQRQPYPWMDIPNTFTPDGMEQLRESLPEISSFRKMVGIKRGYGQGSHDRYLLHYRPDLALSQPWTDFIAELQGEEYQSFLHRQLAVGPQTKFILTFEWYYAWQGCSVSPHCDARRKLATHVFYFNTEADWQTDWGGQILILDDEKRFRPHSAPAFDEFKVAAAIDPRGNGSLFFQRTEHSWHGVRPLAPPPDHMRKLFLVTVNLPTLQVWWRKVRGKDPDGYRIKAD